MSSWSLQGQHWRQLRCESKIEVSEVGTDFRTHAVAAEKGRRQPGPWKFKNYSRHSLKFLESVSRSSVPRSGSTKSWWHW